MKGKQQPGLKNRNLPSVQSKTERQHNQSPPIKPSLGAQDA